MSADWWRRAYAALKASGVKSSALRGMAFPVGRERRLRLALLQRRALLEAKNNVAEHLFRSQRALAELGLKDLAAVEAAMADPQKRRLVMTFGVTRDMLETELAERYGSETSNTLDVALEELVAEGLVLRVPAQLAFSAHDVFIAVQGRGRPQYEVGEINRLLREGRDYRGELRARARREAGTERGRTYRL